MAGINLPLLLILITRNTSIRIAVLVVVGMGVGGVALYWMLQFFRRRLRTARLQTAARQLGFSFTPKTAIPNQLVEYEPFSIWRFDFPNILNVMHGSRNGLDVLLFDYRQAYGKPDSYGKGG